MKNVSNQYRQSIKERRDFYAVAKITFSNGVIKTLSKKDFVLSGNDLVESAERNSFPVGVFVPKRINISFLNNDDRWLDYDFYGAKIFLQTKFDLDDGRTESLNIGTFTVITPEEYGSTVGVTAMDDSYKTDKDYDTRLTYPLQLGRALRDSCQTCGITLLTTTFPNDDYVIPQKPENLTHRQFIGMCAMIAGGNAVFDEYNRLLIKTYDFTAFEKNDDKWGGIFDNLSEKQYMTGNDIHGGVFKPWDVGEADNPVFSDLDNIHVLYQFKSGIKIGVDDVVITGIQIIDKEKNVHLYGSEGYVLSIENQLASGKEDEIIRRIGTQIVGLRFRPFSGDHIAYPLAEFMDLAYVIDRQGYAYRTVLTDINFTYYGFTTLKCSADSPIRNSSMYYGNEVKAIVRARQNTEHQISEYDRSVQKLTELITQSFGVYKTEEVLPDGSTIFYMHDKPTLNESKTIWRMAADAFGVSTDGGKTWNAGMDSQGNAVVNVLSAIGINADWINAGTIDAINIVGSQITGSKIVSKNSDGTVILDYGQLLFYYGNPQTNLAGYISPGRTNVRVNNSFQTVDVLQMNANGDCGLLFSISRAPVIEIINDRPYASTTNMYTENVHIFNDLTVDGALCAEDNLIVGGDLMVYGSEDRVSRTDHYGERLEYCYEMTSPMFGDIGEGITDQDGECIIDIDDIFSETVATNIEYQVFLQKEGAGDIWVAEKTPTYFTVKGTPNLRFAWEVKVTQKDYEFERLEEFTEEPQSIDDEIENMENSYIEEMEQFINEQEGLYETTEIIYGDECIGNE